jgi:site-specific DNA-methyltransferase (adenine-specific)
MGKDWDKALPSIDIWKESVRVLKPGGFAFIMSAPRSDVHSRMCLMLEDAGFRIDFTPIAWTYATGFPKAMNIGKAVDKRMGKEREVTGTRVSAYGDSDTSETNDGRNLWGKEATEVVELKNNPASDKAKELDGSYAGYQPKPAWENVIVCMKPLDQKGYLDQALSNGKGVTWLDGVRIPFQGQNDIETYENDTKGFTERSSIKEGEAYTHNPSQQWGLKKPKTTNRKPREENTVFKTSGFKSENNDTAEASPLGRFAANLLVQDDVLGIPSKGAQAPTTGKEPSNYKSNNTHGEYTGHRKALDVRGDEGTFSRYYDLDSWWESRIQELPLDVQVTYPFLIVPKASKSEKNKGTDEKNFHPTVKPISLMSYLVTLGSREDDLVLDPFVGSGTTCIAAKLLNRKYIGMEMDSDYVVIAQERIKAHKPEEAQHDFF